MLEVVPYELDEIKNLLKVKAITEFGLNDAEFEGSHVSQLINLLAYSTVINNTNFTFGLNEMFITQAKDRRNVIKHARQMGYKHKRNVSYQYKIKLKVVTPGEITLGKYSTFKSNGNDYIYLGNSITDLYGTYANIKLLSNEFNNNQIGLYLSPDISPSKFIITEEGLVSKILIKEVEGSPKFLLEPLEDNSEVPLISNIGKEVYVYDGTRNQGYRNFVKVGSVDTFLVDKENNMMKVQISRENGIDFPFPIEQEQSTELNEFGQTEAVTIIQDGSLKVISRDTKYIISSIEKLIILDNGELYIPLNEIAIGDKNISISASLITIDEDVENSNITVDDVVTHSVSFIANREIADGSTIQLLANNVLMDSSTFSVDYALNKVSINSIVENDVSPLTLIVGTTSTFEFPNNTAKDVNEVIISNDQGEEYDYESAGYSYTFDNEKIIFQLNGANTDLLNGYFIVVNYNYYLKTEELDINIKYYYLLDIVGKEALLTYNYTSLSDGSLAKRIYFSDLRGETRDNENSWNKILAPNGWDGFYAYAFDEETNVLYFKIGTATESEILSGITSGQSFHNPYVSVNGTTEGLDSVLNNPFRKTRFSICNEIWDTSETELLGYTPFDPSTTFASVESTYLKNEVEIIVKEGIIKKWNVLTDQSYEERELASENNLPIPEPVYENPELKVIINQNMVDAGYFSIRDEFIEDTGLELFVTRVLDDGTIVYDEFWEQRNYLLAEETETDLKSFVSMTDVNYEDFINVYTRYAGTGAPLSLDMTVKMNILTSKGPEGASGALIEPNDSNFEAKYYIEETLTPSILHITGSKIMSTDEIRETAPLFSNTANRAVTKQDYKTICEAQPYIQSAQVWGGEEETPRHIPGHIFFSVIPYSRPITFDKQGQSYELKNINNSEVFYPSYYQITGKNSYERMANKTDQEVLFNMLDNYKIITLQLDYIKTIYLDYTLDVEVLKYRFGQTVADSNEQIYNSIRKYFIREIESYDSIFYDSSLIRHIDDELGDSFGVSIDTKFSVDLYDSIYTPDEGTFTNAQKEDLSYNNMGIVGDDDLWKFIMPIDMPIEALFEDSIFVDGVVQYRGRMIIDHITNCNTGSFIIPGDFLYMELDDGTFVSHNADGVEENILANIFSEVIEINIIYTKNYNASKLFDDKEINPLTSEPYTEDEVKELGGERFKVGSYFIHKTESIIRLELNTHSYWHIDSTAVVLVSDYEENNHHYDIEGNKVYFRLDDPENYEGMTKYYQVGTNGEIETEPVVDINDVAVLNEDGTPLIINKITLLEQNPLNDSTSIMNIPVPYADLEEKVQLYSAEGEKMYNITSVPLPREYFTKETRTMNIKPKGDNIKLRRNVFGRMRSLNFK